MSAVFAIRQLGPHSSVQDGGRKGYLRYGVPASGAMDATAIKVANVALGNAVDASVVEVSLGGLVLDCVEGEVTVAIAGGAFQVMLGDARRACWTVVTTRAGTRLTIRPGDAGNWACLAFAGALRSPHWLESAATHGSSGLGGGVLHVGDRLVVDDAEVRPGREGDIPLPLVHPSGPIRVVIGPQERFFSTASQAAFLAGRFTLTDAYDRMGVRLSGPAMAVNAALDMPSEAILRGSVQISGDGVATVLLADHQTTGGYPKIATIVGADLDRFAQSRSGDMVSFRAIAPQDAVAAHRADAALFAAYLEGLSRPAESLMQRLHGLNLIDGVVSGTDPLG